MIRPSDLISSHYVGLNRELHERPKGFGGKGKKWVPTVLALIRDFGASSVLDYGCGQGTLVYKLRHLTLHVRLDEYDPAIPGKDAPPVFADLVVCTDVLEHVEPEKLSAVLTHLKQLARKAVLFVVALDEANKILADGRNAHLIQQPRDWWNARVQEAGFELVPWRADWPLPLKINANPEKQSKRWIAVGIPC